MSTAAPVPVRTHRGRLARIAIIAAIVLALLGLAGNYLLQPRRASALLLDHVGNALGLRITASGPASYRLRGTPQLVLHGVVAQRPGDAPLLRAERVFVSLPWSTIRARGADLSAQRIELDGPVLDLPALQRWLASRPPSETRIPILSDGLHVVRGRIEYGDWRMDGIGIQLPTLAPGKPLHAHVQGRYLAPPTSVPFDLGIALTKPASDAGMAVIGTATLQADDWKLPTNVYLAGRLHLEDGDTSIAPAKIGLSARYVSATSNLPFVLGAAGPLRASQGVLALDPAVLVLHGHGVIPDAQAKGALAFGHRLVLRLGGHIAAWPQAWPALPPPLSASTSPMGFTLDYLGRVDFSDTAALTLRRDATAFNANFKLPAILDWIDAGQSGSPLPPLVGRLQTPRLVIAGATLEGVDVEFDDDASEAPAPP